MVGAENVERVAVEAGRSQDGSGLHAAADGLNGNVRGRLARARWAHRRVDEVGKLVDLRDEVLRIDVVRRFGDGRSRAEVGGRAECDFEREALRLQHAAVGRVEDVGVELVVVAVGVDGVAGDFCTGAGAVVDEAHGVALVDEVEAGALEGPVVVAREDEEVVLGGQAVQWEGGGAGGIAADGGHVAVGLLAEEDGAGDAVLQMQVAGDDGAVGVHQAEQLRAHGILDGEDE